MRKKRTWFKVVLGVVTLAKPFPILALAVPLWLLGILTLAAPSVEAGCCWGTTGCSRAFSPSECSSLTTYTDTECEDFEKSPGKRPCDIMACCHKVTGLPKATYRETCEAISTPPPPLLFIKLFTTNPSAEEANANSICAAGVFPCSSLMCEGANPAGCKCGSTLTTSASPYCCEKDNAIFGNVAACSASASCKVAGFFNLSGKIFDKNKKGIEGAQVKAGGKQALSGPDGSYMITGLPSPSTGTVIATKDMSINSTSFSIGGANIFIDLTLKPGVVPPITGEKCDVAGDQDGDQPGWSVPGKSADWCDSECPSFDLVLKVKATVQQAFYQTPEASCNDVIDNDCDGKTDCEDPDCATAVTCKKTKCGDAIVQFPNSDGVFEQCDGIDDKLCPGACDSQCKCTYKAVCGNSIIDVPLENCDGIYDAATDSWVAGKFNTKSDCTQEYCGKPGSSKPCRCPPPQICGNGIKEAPEDCDGGPLAKDADKFCPSAGPEKIACNPDCTCPPQPIVCGNNLIEPGEDCDGVFNPDDPAPNPASLPFKGGSWKSFKTKKFGCVPSACAPPKKPWIDADPAYHKDALYKDLLKSLGAPSECSCPTLCKQSPPGPVLTKLTAVQFKKEITIDWTDVCQKNLVNYNIFRCVASDDTGTGCTDPTQYKTPLTADPLPLISQFKDTNFPVDSLVCYKIVGQYDTLTAGENTKSSFQLEPKQPLKAFDLKVMCMRAGSDACYTLKTKYGIAATEMCALEKMNVRSTCDANNQIIPVADPDPTKKVDCNKPIANPDLCVGPYTTKSPLGKTECIPRSLCEWCGDPFGLFSYSAKPGSSDPKKDPKNYGEAPKKQGLKTLTSCLQLNFCYSDYSYTSVDKFKQLRPGMACYDYLSQEACVQDKKQIGNCEWRWHPRYKELGIGVCRSNVSAEQRCNRCHDPLNEVFGKCDRETCSLYGRCYYDRDNLGKGYDLIPPTTQPRTFDMIGSVGGGTKNLRCMHERELGCVDYDSEEDCTSSAIEHSLQGTKVVKSNVILDVNGSMIGSAFLKTTGSNALMNRSDDFFGFGKCQWRVQHVQNKTENFTRPEPFGNDPHCIKNSDSSRPVYQEGLSTPPDPDDPKLDWKLVYSFEDDCPPDETGAILNVTLCRKDTAEPVTSVMHANRIGGKFKIPAVVDDNSVNYSSFYPVTFVCVADGNKTRYCYPTGKAALVSVAEGNLITEKNVNVSITGYNFSEKGFKSGVHTFYFFSEDVSHNLEVVRNFSVYIDADVPNVEISTKNYSFEIFEDEWRTNVTMTMKIAPLFPDDDKFAVCDARLYRNDKNIYTLQNIVAEYNNSWERSYGYMPDGEYVFSYRCEDAVGNVAEKNSTWIIDGDKSITNPLPRGTLNTTTISLSVETGTNAECRYLRSEVDISPFNETPVPGKVFSSAEFEKMAKFALTGTAGIPRTLHKNDIKTESGFHRFYVKCKMFNDGKIRGNAGDEMRFAVDLVPPVSKHKANKKTYNDFYNSDILVTLSCDDPLIYGLGLQWQYRCDRIYYCLGKDCNGFGDYKLFKSAIALEKTQFISYYAVDKGNNKQKPVENALFQIDKEPPKLDLTFYDGTTVAPVLILDVPYKVVLNSSKDLIPSSIESTRLHFSSQPAKFTGTLELLPTANPKVREGLFRIKNINANRGFEGTGVFAISVHDYHNVSATLKFQILIDTKPPNAPTLVPSLLKPSAEKSEYESKGYPLHYANGVYYTNGSSLFITGYTDELLNVIAVSTTESIDQEQSFAQTNTSSVFNDQVISGFGNDIRLQGNVLADVKPVDFVGFDTEQKTIGPRTTYGSFGLFYDITSLAYVGGDEDYTAIKVHPALEAPLPVGKKIFFYSKESPTHWFGVLVPTPAFKNTTVYLKAYDTSKNLVRLPAITDFPTRFTFFSDPKAPTVESRFPKQGTTADTTFTVYVILKEGKHESGIDNATISVSINGKPVPFVFRHDLAKEKLDASSNYYRIETSLVNLKDGDYTVSVKAKDYAANPIHQKPNPSTWTFTVDHLAPHTPAFTLVGGTLGPDDRWYSNKPPQFTLEFSDSDPVTIVDTFMENIVGPGGAAACQNTSFNKFLCTFTTPKTVLPGFFWSDYAILIAAFKTLADGTKSPTGIYGPFEFTVDNEAPKFKLSFNTRVRKSYNSLISADVANENHPLFSKMKVRAQEFLLVSSQNGSTYTFTWNVPDYSKLAGDEGPATMAFTLSDYAQNANTATVPIYIDLTPPSVTNVDIKISNTITIGGEQYTSHANVTITGDFVDDDVVAVWTVPGDFNETTGKIEDQKMATLIKDASGIAKRFSVEVRLKGDIGFTEVNNMVLVVKDAAGYETARKLRVIKDLEAPKPPIFCAGVFCTTPPKGNP